MNSKRPSDIDVYIGLAACNPGREARFRYAGLFVAMRFVPTSECSWEAKVWAGRHKTPSTAQLEGIVTALELEFWRIESYLSADFESYVYVIRGGRSVLPSLMREYESIIERRHEQFAPILAQS